LKHSDRAAPDDDTRDADDDDDNAIVTLAKLVYLLGRAEADGVTRPHGVTVTQYGILRRLAARPGMSGVDLARSMSVSPQALMELVVGLEKQGLIVRYTDDRHRRVRRSRLTTEGLKVVESCRPSVEAVEDELLAAFAPAERQQLRALLRRFVQTVGARQDKRPAFSDRPPTDSAP